MIATHACTGVLSTFADTFVAIVHVRMSFIAVWMQGGCFLDSTCVNIASLADSRFGRLRQLDCVWELRTCETRFQSARINLSLADAAIAAIVVEFALIASRASFRNLLGRRSNIADHASASVDASGRAYTCVAAIRISVTLFTRLLLAMSCHSHH